MRRISSVHASRIAAIGLSAATLIAAVGFASCENPIAVEAQALQAKAISPIVTLSQAGGAALASGASLDFGLISLGSSCDIVLTIGNTGPSSLAIDVAGIKLSPDSSTMAGVFSIASLPPSTVASKASVSFSLRFSPESAGAKSATLLIPTNDVLTPSYSITLKGSGWAVVLATNAATNIGQATATSGGNITDDGGQSIIERGIAWGTSRNPTIADSKASDGGSGTGLYSCLMANLAPGTLYYVRAYASNSSTTGYGSQVSFATLPSTPSLVGVSPVGYPAGKKQLSISWTSANGSAAHYDVYYGATPTFSSATLGPSNLTGASCVVDNLGEFTGYYAWVVAKNASGTSSPSTTMGSPVSTGIHVTGVSLDQASLELGASPKQLAWTVTPTNASNPNVSWSISSGGAYASVANGLVSRIAHGQATVTVTTADQAKTASCAVTVLPLIKTLASGLNRPQGLAADFSGNVYVADTGNSRIVKIDSAGNVTTFAGIKGSFWFSGYLANDNDKDATTVKLGYPDGVAVDGSGNVYIADSYNNCVRKVDTSGKIWTIAGDNSGNSGFSGDGGAATSAALRYPMSVAVNSAGTIVYIADMGNDRVRRISGGNISTIVGTGTSGRGADGVAGTSSALNSPIGVATNADGSILYIADSGNQRIRKWTSSDSKVTTVVGTGSAGFSGDGGLATAAMLHIPHSVATDSGGSVLFVADGANNRVRKIVTATGIISTYAGSASTGYTGDGGLATDATLGYYSDTYSATYFFGVACDPSGTGKVYIGDTVNNCVRMVY
jgi:DNA-binding beta-propeller fold protein YncE